MKSPLPLALVLIPCGLASCTAPPPAPPLATTAIHPVADPETRALAERERARREQALHDARALLESGKRKAADGDLEGAVGTFRQSIDTHP
jgi:hypothetical protein